MKAYRVTGECCDPDEIDPDDIRDVVHAESEEEAKEITSKKNFPLLCQNLTAVLLCDESKIWLDGEGRRGIYADGNLRSDGFIMLDRELCAYDKAEVPYDFTPILAGLENGKPLEFVGYPERNIAELKDERGVVFHINRYYYDFLALSLGYEFRGSGLPAPIGLVCDGRLVGAVMPIHYRANKKEVRP